MRTAMAKIVRMNDFGLFEVEIPEFDVRTGFTLKKLRGYRGEPPRRLGLKPGAWVKVNLKDDGERIESAFLPVENR